MSRTESSTDNLTSEEFETALADLIRTADRDDVETPRSVDVRTDADGTELMVEITRIERHS